jgi:hypothetical protein
MYEKGQRCEDIDMVAYLAIPVSFIVPLTLSPLYLLLLGRLGVYTANLCASYNQLYHNRRATRVIQPALPLPTSDELATFSSQLKAKVGHILAKVEVLRINLNLVSMTDLLFLYQHTITLHTLKPVVS